jgi:hypothetical protein
VIVASPQQHLRRYVFRSATERIRFECQLCQAKVRQPYIPVLIQEDVFGFQVSI